nr:MAG TPA: hypothetical protein [Microviridae sp.]
MSLQDKVNSIKEIVTLIVTLLPKVVDTILEVILLIKESKAA